MAIGNPRIWFWKVALDAVAVALAVSAAYLLRFEGLAPERYANQAALAVVVLPLLRVVANAFSGVYALNWSLSSLPDLLRLLPAGLVVSALPVVLRALGGVVDVRLHLPFSVIAVEALVSLAGMATLRVGARVMAEQRERGRRQAPATTRRALLIGAGRTGAMAARELAARPDLGYTVVGLLDDDRSKHGQRIHGARVLGDTSSVGTHAAAVGADAAILTIPSASREQIGRIADACASTGLPLQTVPAFHELVSGRLHVTKIRPLQIEDLLGRQVVLFDPDKWKGVVARFGGKRILVTGAGGSIGSELCRQLTRVEPETLVMVENHENNLFAIDQEIQPLLGSRAAARLVDVRDEARLRAVYEDLRPQVVFHAAAFKHVPLMEAHPLDAVDNNVFGTQMVARMSADHDVETFVLVSTDKAVRPTNVMGATKRVAELVVAGMPGDKTRFCAVRFGNVLGSRGSVVHTFSQQIARGGPVTVTHAEATRFFMTIPEAVQLVIQAGSLGEGGDVFVLEMGEAIKIYDLARQMIRLAGAEADVDIEVIGLRPGEKLFEELITQGETTVESGLPDVQRVSSNRSPAAEAKLHADLGRLKDAVARGATSEIREILLSMDIGYRRASHDEASAAS